MLGFLTLFLARLDSQANVLKIEAPDVKAAAVGVKDKDKIVKKKYKTDTELLLAFR